MNSARALAGLVLCATGACIAKMFRASTTSSPMCPEPTKGVGRLRSETSAAEIYGFQADASRGVADAALVKSEDLTVKGDLQNISAHIQSCGSCEFFTRQRCPMSTPPSYTEGSTEGFCKRLQEPTTSRGHCDLWAQRRS